MEYIPQSEAERFEMGSVTSWEYRTSSEVMNVALIQISGRYPESGYVANTEVDSLVQVISGEGLLVMATGEKAPLSMGGQIHLAKDEAYFFEGNLELVYAAAPKWTPEQASHQD